MNEEQLINAAALTMREKIAQCVEGNPRPIALEFAARIRNEIRPVTPEQVRAYAALHKLPGISNALGNSAVACDRPVSEANES